jgi:hypothetical protein
MFLFVFPDEEKVTAAVAVVEQFVMFSPVIEGQFLLAVEVALAGQQLDESRRTTVGERNGDGGMFRKTSK